MRTAVDAEETAFVLIGGPYLTGRTSMANWVLDRYADLRGVGERFLPVRVQVADHDPFRWLRTAMMELDRQVRRHKLRLNDDVRDNLRRNREVTREMAYEQVFQASAEEVSLELANSDDSHAFGVVFESVPNPGFVAAAKASFTGSPAVIVFTYDDYKNGQTADARRFDPAQFGDDICGVELPRLSGRQVCMLAEGRWAVASNRRCPFDADGLEYQYRNQVTPIKMALPQLERVLDFKLGVVDECDLEWPENEELSIPRKLIEAAFRLMEAQR